MQPYARFAHNLLLPPLHSWYIAKRRKILSNQSINQSTLLLGVFSKCLHSLITHNKQHKKCLDIEITFWNVFFIISFLLDSFLAKKNFFFLKTSKNSLLPLVKIISSNFALFKFKETWILSPEEALCQIFVEIYLVVLETKMEM